MSAVRPEFGPTLPDLARPVLRRLPRRALVALAVVAVLVLAGVAVRLLSGGEDRTAVVVRDVPAPFNFAYQPDRLSRTAPQGREAVALQADGLRYAVSPLRLESFRGDASGVLPVLAAHLQGEMAQGYEGFTLRQEGRANINRQQGYELWFQFRRDGATWYGRRVMLLPTPLSRDGADIVLLARRTERVPKFSSVGGAGPLKVALRSFRFGTERP
ncbi:MAG TPA: hypothetical protein VD931_20865 [Baekduia sp.]|nr:hypothetical protein [Baekduia sp.]